MKPINIDNELHTQVKILAARTGESMYQIATRYVKIGLWYDSLEPNVQVDVKKEIEQFLIDKGIK